MKLTYKEDTSQFWEDIYLEEDAGWDLDGPTPVFDKIADDLTPGKLCIIGCGRGYDAIMFAQKGFDVTAIDFAPSVNSGNKIGITTGDKIIASIQSVTEISIMTFFKFVLDSSRASFGNK